MGAKTGSTIRVISIQSKKKPRKNTTPISTNRMPQGPKPSCSMKSITRSSPPSERNT